MKRLTSALVAATLVAAPATAQDAPLDPIDQFTSMDLVPVGTGVVIGLYHEGQVDFLEAWGTVAADTTEAMTVAHVFPFWEMTPVLLAVTARGLAAGGAIDLDRPLGEMMTDVSPALADVTLEQLLRHRAGLDDAAAAPGFDWEAILTDLPANARVLPPGTAFSLSRYSYPAVAAVLERATGLEAEELLQQAVLTPLGLARSTFDRERAQAMGLPTGYMVDGTFGDTVTVATPGSFEGLPVLYTSAPDLIQFMVAWVGGALAAGDPLDGVGPIGRNGQDFKDGVFIEDFRGVPQMVVDGAVPGFGASVMVLPRSETVLVGWKNSGRSPRLTLGYVQGLVAAALELPEPPEVDSLAARRPLPPADEWAGVYGNGDRIMVLREGADGELVAFAGQEELELRPTGEDAWWAFTSRGEGTSIVFELETAGDLRLMRMANRVYVRLPDEPGG